MPLAATFFDLVVGMDIHVVLIPPAPPVPMPMPYLGMIFDPAHLVWTAAINIVAGSPPSQGLVLVNGLPAGFAGMHATNTLGVPHLPPPVIPPDGKASLTGSQTVSIGFQGMTRNLDAAFSCSDPVPLPTSMVLATPKGMPVLVGGPPGDVSVVDLAFRSLHVVSQRHANQIDAVIGRIRNPRVRNLVQRLACFSTGHPVDVATGRMFTDAVDWHLPGPIPLKFERVYASCVSDRDSTVGYGWNHSLDEAVWVERGCVVYRAGDGREIEFDTLPFPKHRMRVGDSAFAPIDRLTLRALASGWEVETHDGIVREFAIVAGDPAKGRFARLQRIRDREGHTVALQYDRRACLEWVTDSEGRTVHFAHDEARRLVRVSLPNPSGEGWLPHTTYRYSPEGDLTEVIDPLGNASRYVYERHLMVQETDRTGLNFYFGYDGSRADAWCVRTWGDGGIFDHEITYDKAKRVTVVTNSLGKTTVYRMSPALLVTSVMTPLGEITQYEYDDAFRRVREIDPLGRETHWTYDERGNLVHERRADGTEVSIEYDERNLPTSYRDPLGGVWEQRYDARGRLVAATNAAGETIRREYDAQGRLVAVIDATGAAQAFDYEGTGTRVAAVRDARGAESAVFYDRRGRVRALRDPLGGVRRVEYDVADRVVRCFDVDGDAIALKRDAEGNLLERTDPHGSVRWSYTGMHKVSMREQAGDVVRFRYNTEDQLTDVVNEAGESYRLVRDANGHVREEWDFDRRCTMYRRDKSARLVAKIDAANELTEWTYDAAGRVVAITLPGGVTQTFAYRDDGVLIEATNPTTTVRFERDSVGRLVREWQGDHWVASQLDAGGDRIVMESSLGARVAVVRDAVGAPQSVSAGSLHTPWRMDFERNALGQETARHMPGGVVAQWERDAFGRPSVHRVWRGSVEIDALSFRWDGMTRLAGIVDPAEGALAYVRDARGRPTEAWHSDGHIEYRAPDKAGNLFKRADRTDRRYSDSGALLEADGATYAYDARGRLVEKRAEGGARWQYEWDAAGLLAKVVRPDDMEVSFEYDALGRRITKRSREREVRWVWDRNVVLHELASDAAPATWLTEPEGFAPIAKNQGGRWHSVTCDHVGAPTALYDDAGALAWKAQLDLYGVPRQDGSPTDTTDCPWRWPGQYEDKETGLYYNRWRYYDPEAGEYIAPDPLGLLGGLRQYGYVEDPTRWIDPWGLCPESSRTSNPLPEDGLFSRVMARQYAETFARGESTFARSEEVFIGAASDLSGVTTPSGAQQRLALFENFEATARNVKGDTIVLFRLRDVDAVGLRSPIETVPARGYGYVHGGRTGGGAREWLINNGTANDIGAYDIQLVPLK